jgi:hypothetical protein
LGIESPDFCFSIGPAVNDAVEIHRANNQQKYDRNNQPKLDQRSTALAPERQRRFAARHSLHEALQGLTFHRSSAHKTHTHTILLMTTNSTGQGEEIRRFRPVLS